MELRRAYELVNGDFRETGRFYGPADNAELGAGLILTGVAYPLYSDEEGEFVVVEGMVYLLSHECDIDPENGKPFSDRVAICPVIPLASALASYLRTRSSHEAGAFFGNIGKHLVERLAYLPTIADHLPDGGLLYFGALTHTHVDEIIKPTVIRCGVVSSFGLRTVDLALQQALHKPKSRALPLSGDLGRWEPV